MSDHNRKTLRSFQCRDHLWDTFSQMSSALECSVDYLINEAMRQYARSRNYAGPSAPPPPMSGGMGGMSGGLSGPPSLPGGMGAPPSGSYAGAGARTGPPPPPAPPRPPSPYGSGFSGPSGSYTNNPPPLPPSSPPSFGGGPAPSGLGAYPSAGQTLSVIFNGQKIPVTKPVFKIGRGAKTADLPIKDGNVSREHAAVVRRDNAYYIRDLGSLNGVEYEGRKVSEKRIEEGDVFRICDYAISFTYR